VIPPDSEKDRIERYFDPLPIWYSALEEEGQGQDDFPLHAVTQRPMHMYHSWGGQNAWLRQITARNPLFIHAETAAAKGIADGDWLWVTSPHGRVKAQAKLMQGVNPHTVWTWNAIGKRKGAWNLKEDAPEATKGFLLNHIISGLLPAREDGYRYSNSDPVTGQAAWYDLRVKIEKCAADEYGETEPMLDPQDHFGLPEPTELLRYGADLKGEASDLEPVAMKDWIGNREENAGQKSGIRPGHGNQLTDVPGKEKE